MHLSAIYNFLLNHQKSTLSLSKMIFLPAINRYTNRLKEWELNDFEGKKEKDACGTTAEKLHVALRQNMTRVSSLGVTIPSFGKA